MNFIPVLIISLILLIITVLLAIADRLLVTYGKCKITVEQDGELKEFAVQGGNSLLSNLIENKINISSSCAGKASCGYCKVRVLNGGGQILPTEEIFMSREEKLSGMRLSCQVKVKEDLKIYIPDFLTTVRTIVKNKTYDPKLRWKFMKDGQLEVEQEKRKVKLDHKEKEKLSAIIEEHKNMQGALVPVLQRINSTFNYLPEPALRFTADSLSMPLSEVYRIATFYNAFSLKPRGKHLISVCLGTACHVKGVADVMSALENKLGIKAGETTEDRMFSLQAVRCIGCCGLAPVLTVGKDVHSLMTVKKVPQLIETYSKKQEV